MLRYRVEENTEERPRVRLCELRFSRQAVDDIEQVLRSGMLREGSITERFEDYFKKRVQAQYAYSVSSGTAALHLALMSSVPPGSEVLVPAFTFIATASAVVHADCIPVFVDVDPDTFLFDVDDAWEKVNERTRAVVPVHLFGNLVDHDGLLELSEEYDLRIVHDCAQALGSTLAGVEMGELRDICCYSFYPSKMITTGEGGMVTTNNEEYAYRGRLLKSHGEETKYHHTILGYNYRTSEVSSILGLDQMNRLERSLERRRGIARIYDAGIGNIRGIKPQKISAMVNSCYNYYTVQIEHDSGLSRDQIVQGLSKMGVETAIHYPRALTEQPALEKYIKQGCPEAESLCRRVFSIPIHTYMSEEDAQRVVQGLRETTGSYL
jgi:perosamine synthetase